MRRRLQLSAGDERGQALVLVCVFLVVLLGMAALALDVGNAYLAKRRMQASVDAAALAGAQDLPSIADATILAHQFGSDGKNLPRGVDGVQMTVSTRCLRSAPGCAPANAVVVKESGTVATHFASVLGIRSFTVHAQATACSPCGEKPLDIMLVLDRTGSMCTTESGAPDPACTDMNNARQGMKTFLGLLDPTLDHVGLAVLPPATSVSTLCSTPPASSSYDSTSSAYVIVPLSSDYLKNGVLNSSSNLVSTLNCVQANGWTAYANALEQAQAELVRDGRPGVEKVIVFMSDGAANTGPLYYPASSPYLLQPCHQGMRSAQTIAGSGTVVFSIGYDVGHDRCQAEDKKTQTRSPESPSIDARTALEGIASDPGNYYDKPTAGQLNTIFTAIAADILRGTSKLVDDNA